MSDKILPVTEGDAAESKETPKVPTNIFEDSRFKMKELVAADRSAIDLINNLASIFGAFSRCSTEDIARGIAGQIANHQWPYPVAYYAHAAGWYIYMRAEAQGNKEKTEEEYIAEFEQAIDLALRKLKSEEE